MGKEEYILQLGMLEQEANSLQQRMQIVEQQVLEIQTLGNSLKEIEKTQEKEMLANLGKNIFVKTEIQNKELLVDIGNKIFLKKNIPETLKIIETQIDGLMKVKKKILEKLQEIQEGMERIITEAEKEK